MEEFAEAWAFTGGRLRIGLQGVTRRFTIGKAKCPQPCWLKQFRSHTCGEFGKLIHISFTTFGPFRSHTCGAFGKLIPMSFAGRPKGASVPNTPIVAAGPPAMLPSGTAGVGTGSGGGGGALVLARAETGTAQNIKVLQGIVGVLGKVVEAQQVVDIKGWICLPGMCKLDFAQKRRADADPVAKAKAKARITG